MLRTPPFLEIPRHRSLILHDDDDDDDGGGAGEAAAGGSRHAQEERFHDLGQNPLAPSSSSQSVATVGSPEIIVIDDDEEEAEVEVQPAGGQGGGLVKEEIESDDGVDWDALEEELSSSDEDPGVSRGSKVDGGASSSRGVGMDRQEGTCEDGEEGEQEEEFETDLDGAEEEQDKDEDEWELEEEEEDEDDDEEEMEEDQGGAEESEAEEEPHPRVPSNGRAAGRYAGEIFPKRKFEGWYIARMADATTAAESGNTVAARTRARRSRRRCLDRKLLKQGTCTYPYRVHTASSESSRELQEDGMPTRAPAHSFSEEREVDGGGASYRKTATGQKRHRGKKTAHGDDDSESEGYGGGQAMVAKRRVKRHMEPNATGGHGDDDESEEDDRPFPCSRGPKRGSAFCAVKNKGVPADGFDQHQQGDVIFKKSAFVLPRGRCHRDRETYDDLLDSIFEGIEKYQNGSAPSNASLPPEQEQGCDTFL